MKLFGTDGKEKQSTDKKVAPAQQKQAARPAKEPFGQADLGASGRRYIIKKPLLTEKASLLQAEENKYVFVVHPEANKSEVKKEIERLFNVEVEGVNIINQPRKRKVWRGHVGFTAGDKKAVVTVEEGKKIDILPT